MSQTNTVNPALIGIATQTTYLPSHSSPQEGQYTFAYTITISNASDIPVQLLQRHWEITDADGEVQDIRGEGVVGEQPVIQPGRFYRYTSGVNLTTPVGFMKGEYTMIVHSDNDLSSLDSEMAFDVDIPAFTLHTPTSLN